MVVAGVLVLVAALSALSRAMLPWAERYQPDLEAVISEYLDTPVRFGSVDLRWQGYQPQLVLEDVRIASGPRMASLSLGLSVWRSLTERRLVADKITLDAPRFTLIRGAKTGWSIADLAFEPRLGASGQSISWADLEEQLVRLGHVSIRDAVVEFRAPDGSRDRLEFSVAAQLDRDRWRASGTALMTGISDEPMQFSGEGAFGAQAGNTLFLRVDGWKLAAVQRRLDRYGGPSTQRTLGGCPGDSDPESCEVGMPRIDSGDLDGRLWLDWQAGHLDAVTIAADVRALAVTRENLLGSAAQQATLAQVSANLAWQRNEQGWRLDAQDIEVHPTDGPRLPTEFVRLIAQGDQTRFATNHADIDQLAVWLAAAPLPRDFLRLLDQNVPRGQARDVRLAFDGGRLTQGFLQLENFGNTSGVPLRPVVGTRSGEGGADLTLYRQPAGWLAQIDQYDLILAVPGMFREPVAIDHIQGNLYWFDRNGFGLYSPSLAVNSQGLRLGGRFFYRAGGPAEPGYLGIDAGFSLADSRTVPGYLPRHLMGGRTLQWLDGALEGPGAQGEVTNGRFIFHGDPARAPFDQGGGHFSVVFDFNDFTLPYRPDWPPLTEASGHMAFVNQQYHVDLESGRVDGLTVGGARVSIFDMEQPKLQLALDRRVPLDDLLSGLGRTPLMEADALAGISASGEGRFELDVLLGLREGAGAPRVTGAYTFDGNQLGILGDRFRLDRLQGRLGFEGPRFSANSLRGRFLDQPFTARVAPREGIAATRVTAETHLTPAGLGEVMQSEAPWVDALLDRLSGETGMTVRVDVPHGSDSVAVRVDSDLSGWESRLPAPFAKPAALAWPLRVDLTTTGGGMNSLSARLAARQDWQADLSFNAAGEITGSRVSNRGALDAADQPHRVGIALEELQLAPWVALVGELAGQADGGGMGDIGLRVDAHIGSLGLGDWSMEKVGLDWSSRDDGWGLDLLGEQNRGRVSFVGEAAGSGRLTADVERLRLHRSDADNGSSKEPAPPTAWEIESLPTFDADIAAFTLGEAAMGRLRIGAHWEGDAYLIDRVDWLPTPDLSVTGSGRVENGVGSAPDGQQTRLSLGVHGRDVGAAITSITGDSPLENGQVKEGMLTLTWPGSPASFSVARAAGNGRFLLTDGQLSRIDPGAGRLAGLMSLGALTDRLRLDFRDVTRDGLYFETLAGDLRLDRGMLSINSIELINPSLTALIDGDVDLVDRRLDLTARVYADFGMLLPLIGTVAGGPLVGGAILALQQTFKQLDQAPGPDVVYYIGGSFDQPMVGAPPQTQSTTPP